MTNKLSIERIKQYATDPRMCNISDELRSGMVELLAYREAESKRCNAGEPWCPDSCPITGRKFFMWMSHPTKGMVPTYGGPYDSYTLAEKDSDGEYVSERFDHDNGYWSDFECAGVNVVEDWLPTSQQELDEYVADNTSPVLSQPEPNNSKPVAEIVSKHGDPEAFGERELQVIADIRKMPYGTKLYASPVLGQTQNNDDKKDAERWRFIRKFLAVEDIDGSLDGEVMHVLCIKESAFESSMIGFPRDVSIEVAIDAAIAKATGESE